MAADWPNAELDEIAVAGSRLAAGRRNLSDFSWWILPALAGVATRLQS
jgi:hypothetical protein